MVNDRGWLRIIEATVTVLLVLSVMFFISTKNKATVQEEDLSFKTANVLKEISESNLRKDILEDNSASNAAENKINSFVKERIPSSIEYTISNSCPINTVCNYNFVVKICETDEECALEPKPSKITEEIYANTRLINNYMENKEFKSKKIIIYIWKK